MVSTCLRAPTLRVDVVTRQSCVRSLAGWVSDSAVLLLVLGRRVCKALRQVAQLGQKNRLQRLSQSENFWRSFFLLSSRLAVGIFTL